MVSLYGRLFAYRERPDRKPLEDFLTEALCDILNRLSVAEMAKISGELFLPAAAREAWRRETGNAESLRWTSQERIENSALRIDLLLRSGDDQPLLVVENKIGSGIGRHQLPGYGFWLGKKCKNQTWPGAVALLTHFTAPPEGFGSGDCAAYGVPYQQVCYWPQVWKWLNTKGLQANTNAFHAFWQVLAAELAQFLQKKGMTSETMTLHDVAAAEMYIASTERLCQLFNQIWEEAVFPAWQQSFGRTPAFVSRGPIHHNSYGALLQDWVYLKKPYSPCDDNNWHFAWGIAFPQVGGYWWEDAEPQLPSRTYTFVYLWYEEKNPPLPEISPDILGKLGSGWSVSASDGNCLIKARAMCEFDPDPDRLAEQMIAWIKESAEQLKRVIINIR